MKEKKQMKYDNNKNINITTNDKIINHKERTRNGFGNDDGTEQGHHWNGLR